MRTWRVPYPKFGDGPGLERVTRIAARLDVDLAAFGAEGAAVVGSNGKGSTAAMTAALLQRAGGGVGLFTSPHLLDLNERFRIDGEDIADDALARHWRRVEAAVRAAGAADQIGGFEFLFLIAADCFAARGCRRTVWEAGIGGRLDPVRLIGARQVALTALELEHTALLGETVEDIGVEKIAAAPAGAALFSAVEGDVGEVLARRCAEMGVRYAPVAPYDGAIPLAGAHQRRNAALALHLAMSVTGQGAETLAPGFAATRWPGRLEIIGDDPLVVIDVGHTPNAVRLAREGFEAMRAARAAVLVCGVSEDKDAGAIVSALAPGFAAIVCAAARHKGRPAGEIAVRASEANPDAEIVVAESVADARRIALAKAGPGGAVYVAGGLFLAAEFKAVDSGRDPASLAFF